MKRIPKYTQIFLKKLCNKQSLVFLFFLALSTAFWFLQVLNDVHEEDFDLRINQNALPKGVVVTSDLPSTVRVTIKDRGSVLLNYKYSSTLPQITLDASFFNAQEGHVRILSSELVKQIRPSLSASSQIISIKPDTLDFYYNHGRSKRVPVIVEGTLPTAPGYTIIGREKLSPDSVTVFALGNVLDTISVIKIQGSSFSPFRNSVTAEAKLHTLRGLKIIPNHVKLSVVVDRLVEKKLIVPVGSINVPDDQLFRAFPSQVEITCQVPMSLYRGILPSHFMVAADYSQSHAEDQNASNAKCQLVVIKSPSVASHIRLSQEEVEYVLENRK